MVEVRFEDSTIHVDEKESLLDSLLRQDIEMSYGCRAGVCQSCLVKVDGASVATIKPEFQKGLTAAQKTLGYMLACQCFPAEPMTVKRIGDEVANITAKVVEKKWLNPQVMHLRLSVEAPFEYRPGQYVTLWRDSTLARSYSLASCPSINGQQNLDFHIKCIPDGAFSAWACHELEIGGELSIQGPLGECFYTVTKTEQPLLLAAIGTGLAPIWGILNDAIAQSHQGPIDILVGAANIDGFYYVDELRDLESQHNNINVHFLTQSLEGSDEEALGSIQEADIYAYQKQQFPDLKGYRVFLCGASSFVTKMRRQCFMGGANMPDISADAFIPSA